MMYMCHSLITQTDTLCSMVAVAQARAISSHRGLYTS